MKDVVGYGFRPTDDELVGYYLHNKIMGETRLVEGFISEANICSDDPWNLRLQSKYKSGDLVWYFLCSRDNKYGNGNRQKRTTFSGKWKLTGDPVDVKDKWGTWCGTPGKKIGHKRVLVFLDGRNSDQTKSDWVIHEFHYDLLPEDQMMMNYVICRLEYKGDDINIAKGTDPTPTIVPEAQQFSQNLNMQQQVPYSVSPDVGPQMLWDYVINEDHVEFLLRKSLKLCS